MADLSIPNAHARNIESAPTAEHLITTHLDIWTTAIEQKSSAGRGSSNKFSLYGIKKLRELILEIAVRGKLVPQDVNDSSPQKALLKSIEKKENLIGSGVIKKSRSKKVIKDEHFYSYPEHWETARIEDLINVINGRAYKKHEMLSEGTPLLRVGNLFTSNDWYYSDLDLDSDKYIDNGDLIYAWSASFGPFIWDGGKVIYHYHIWKMDLHSEIALDKSFSKLFLAAISERIKASGNGIAMIHMTKERMEKVIHPLPPLEEQHRIVAKVDELMLLCDALEAQTEASIAAHQTLVETLLNALLLPQTAANTASQSDVSLEPQLESRSQHFESSLELPFTNSFDKDWQRVAEHFDTLFTTAASIDTLKQTILQLAVMGKLVKQDPNDEPAAKLLERIAKEKAQLIKEGKIKKQKPLPAITEEEKPFELPNGWAWVRLGALYSFLNGFAFKSEWFQKDGVKLLRNINIAHSETKWNDQECIPDSMASEYVKYNLSIGDIVISLDRPIINTGLKYAVIEQSDLPCLLLQRVAKFHSYADAVTPQYLSRWLESDLFISGIDPGRSNGVPHISTKQLEAMAFPICSLEQQHRIVAKVDELMALCDQLKARLADAQTTQLHLTDAIVEQAM